jgi:DNA-binding CsgD family transcriptional regulator
LQCQYAVIRSAGWEAVLDSEQALTFPEKHLTHHLEESWSAWATFTPHVYSIAGPLGTQVKRAHDRWRTIVSCQKAYRQLAEQTEPAVEFFWLLHKAELRRFLFWQYLCQHFGYDARGRQFLPGGILLRLTSLGVLMRETILQKYTLYDGLVIRGLLSVLVARTRGFALPETLAFAASSMRGVLDDFPLFTSTGLGSPYQAIAAREAISLSGWAATQIASGYLSQALNYLSSSDESTFQTLLRELPGHVVPAWYDWLARYNTDLRGDTATLLKAIVKSLRQSGPQLASRGKPQVSALDDWLGREEVRLDLDRLSRHAGLTAPEAEVLALTLEGCTQDTIAAYKGVAIGTVKATKSHVLEKLRKTARS